jgi:hypothetical protein
MSEVKKFVGQSVLVSDFRCNTQFFDTAIKSQAQDE